MLYNNIYYLFIFNATRRYLIIETNKLITLRQRFNVFDYFYLKFVVVLYMILINKLIRDKTVPNHFCATLKKDAKGYRNFICDKAHAKIQIVNNVFSSVTTSTMLELIYFNLHLNFWRQREPADRRQSVKKKGP